MEDRYAVTQVRVKRATDVPHLLAVHAISGCDSVSATYGIEKANSLKISLQGYKLSILGAVTASMTQVTEEAKDFIVVLPCYGMKKISSMTECRQRVWAQKTGKASAQRLRSLPQLQNRFRRMSYELTCK